MREVMHRTILVRDCVLRDCTKSFAVLDEIISKHRNHISIHRGDGIDGCPVSTFVAT